MNRVTPMLKQYLDLKGQHHDAILFYRMGDFYEMFFEDAQTASRVLGITLTARGVFQGEKVPMCGVPHHASKSYIAKLVDAGFKVAICEQTEDPKSKKGLVKREVTRIVTPGSIVDEGELDAKTNLYLAAISGDPGLGYGLAYCDLSTGEFRLTEIGSLDDLMDELSRIEAAELLVPDEGFTRNHSGLANYRIEILPAELFDSSRAEIYLREQFAVGSLEALGINRTGHEAVAAGMLVAYLKDNQKSTLKHIKKVTCYRTGSYMFLDEATCTHLELLKTMRRRSVKGSLFDIIDRTVTPMGSRLLKRWISYPLIDIKRIKRRLSAVYSFKNNTRLREEIIYELKNVYDLERLNGKISLGRANARDLLALKASVLRLPRIKASLGGTDSTVLSGIGDDMDCLEDVAEIIDGAIDEKPPVTIHEGGIIKEEYDDELDALIALSRDGKSWIKDFELHEQKRTGISSLKVGFNKVFGYYIEVSKPNLQLVPHDYIRKQTLVNGERYITEALKEKEAQVLGAEEKRVELELRIFKGIVERISAEAQRIKETAELVSRVDVLAGLAATAEINDYSFPEVNEDKTIDIRDGRHPVIERTVKEEDFVPNDILLDSSSQQVLIITGPNMAGKSTVLRQTALTVLMAQMGCFVPASKAVIGLVDRIFTRVGASDDLARGRSTFMVEMNETANILRNATPGSLIILDEVGRGTSTYDGVSIAWAVAEALHDMEGVGIRTLFATHYHELTELAATKRRVKNFNIAVREWNDKIIFLRKIVPGGTSRSYGIQVAGIAGLPEGVIQRAREVLDTLESTEMAQVITRNNEKDAVQLRLFGTRDQKLSRWIKDLDISSLTPLDALVELNKIREYVCSEN